MWKCKKCGSYHISEKVKGSESFEYDKTGEKIINLWSDLKYKAICECCNNTAKKYTFKSNIQEIADWVEEE
ncbi:MAG: hypothetical protein SPH94_08330 [Fusobacterium necrophorum]|nr:hypothetical protein [Fusobacterium necrophorum]